MTTLFASLRRPLDEIVPNIPFLLVGKANEWYYELPVDRAASLQTWDVWCEALRIGLRDQNYDAKKAQDLRMRIYRNGESLSSYYSARAKLQRAVMPTAPHSERVRDMLTGLPTEWHALIKAGLVGEGVTTLDSFRRVLIDLEPSLLAQRRTTQQPRSNQQPRTELRRPFVPNTSTQRSTTFAPRGQAAAVTTTTTPVTSDDARPRASTSAAQDVSLTLRQTRLARTRRPHSNSTVLLERS